MDKFDYDLIVIGGGSGGLAASKEAISCGATKVVVFDYVKPTIHGTKWGLGGTCVNVGCIPKKLMHYAATMGPLIKHDAQLFGWKFHNDSASHDWNQMIATIQSYIKQLNFSYRVGLKSKNVEYINALATVENPHTVSYLNKKNEVVQIQTKYILIAVGGRPYIPSESEVPGASTYAISSDDLFSWRTPPGKTLVVGASYIGLECAGFLTELGYPTTVAVRSILLRGFDRQCAEKVGNLMEELGTRFIYGLPSKIVKLQTGKLLVEFVTSIPAQEFDTVLYAIGRRPDTKGLNLASLGVEMDALGKIIATHEQSSVPSIFAVGDALHGSPELTPVAIRTGELLMRRLFKKSTEFMDWKFIPTTVFTPFEYGSCGMSEENAIEQFGTENIEIFLYEFPTLELSASHRTKIKSKQQDEYDTLLSQNCLSKLICLKTENYRVVGFHYIGQQAGEVTQGYALALRLGATKSDFDATIGIHPTDVESFHSLTITKRSNESWIASGGCGGGKCG